MRTVPCKMDVELPQGLNTPGALVIVYP
jgi:hypothetical protein